MLAKWKKTEAIKEIYETYDYGMFDFMPGNRDLDQERIKRMINGLKKLKENNKSFFNPIRTTPGKKGKLLISDGQHTYIAMKSLGLPIHYFIVLNETIEDVRLLNSNTLNWSIWDYVVSYAKSKNPNYMKIIKLREKYPNYRQNELFIAIALNKYTAVRSGANRNIIKSGKFIFDDYDKALLTLDKLNDFDIVQGASYLDYKFIRAALKLIACSKYDHGQMIRKLEKSPFVYKINSMDGYIEELLKKYNFGYANRLYFHDI